MISEGRSLLLLKYFRMSWQGIEDVFLFRGRHMTIRIRDGSGRVYSDDLDQSLADGLKHLAGAYKGQP